MVDFFIELTSFIETLDPEILAGAIIFYAVVLAAIVAFAVARCLLIAIGYSGMYRKAGVAGWKAFIPVYHTYTNYKIAWNGKMFFLYAALYILFTVTSGGTNPAMQLAAAAAGIALLVVDVKRYVKMAKLFGKGVGTAIALIFFPGITAMILGLGKAEYTAVTQ